MRSTNRIRTLVIGSTLSLAVAGLIVGGYARGELGNFAGMEGRTYHSHLHEKGRCEACHAGKTPAGYPEDGACLKCHRLEKLVAATARESGEERWQNPHDNLHYGTEVPCVECHGEHSAKKPLCADCHNFDYPDHQE